MADEEDKYWPKSLAEAVDHLVTSLDAVSKKKVRECTGSDLIQFHHGWGTGIRNSFGLWAGNNELLSSCACIHPDDASMVIIEGVWRRLQAQEEVYEHPEPDFSEFCKIIVPDFDQINRELMEYFARHPDDLYNLDPREFEKLLDAVFKNQGYRTELGPGWADGGIDLRIYHKDSIGELCTLVQAKRYRPDNPIRIEAVAALDSLVSVENANRGLFVTTSRYLPSTQEFAKRRGHRLTLAASIDVAKWCKNVAENMRYGIHHDRGT